MAIKENFMVTLKRLLSLMVVALTFGAFSCGGAQGPSSSSSGEAGAPATGEPAGKAEPGEGSQASATFNEHPKASLNGVSDSRKRFSRTQYSNGEDALQGCSESGQCWIAGAGIPDWEGEKGFSEYAKVPNQSRSFKADIEYADSYSLKAYVGYLDEKGSPLVVPAECEGDIVRYSTLQNEYGRLYEHSFSEGDILSLAEYDLGENDPYEDSLAYLAIIVSFSSQTYGYADFVFYAVA